MAGFYIQRITVSGGHNTPATVEFTKGLNIVCGPSNTGKSYIIECLDYVFGSKKIRLEENTGYNCVEVGVQVINDGTITFERKFDTKKITVSSTVKDIETGTYSSSTSAKNSISNVWLSLMGIKEVPSIIKNGRFEKQRLTLRSFLHMFLINESNVFQTEPILVSRHDTQKTASLSALLYLMTGLNYEETNPKEEKKIREAKKKAVTAYINKQLSFMADRVAELDKAPIDIQDIQANAESVMGKISETERRITAAIEHSQLLMSEIFDLNEQLAECNLLYDRYDALRTQYNADIKRLTFIVEGEVHLADNPMNIKCPFCNGEINKHYEHSYAQASRAEAERIQLQLKDLGEAEADIVAERSELISRIDELSSERSDVEVLIKSDLEPKLSILNQTLAEYRKAIEIQNEVSVIHQFETSMKSELFEFQNEDEESQTKFDAKSHFDNNMRSVIDGMLEHVLHLCNYDGFSTVYFNQSAFDIVVNGHMKDSFGKGYRAFLNTIVAVIFMEYLSEYGKFTPRILMIDSPILSLKEKVDDEAPESMKAGLFQYLLAHQEYGQVIIVENEIPNLDYNNANVIQFTKDVHTGRYGFLNGIV